MSDEIETPVDIEEEPHATFGGCLLLLVLIAVGVLAATIYDIPYVDEVMESEYVVGLMDKLQGGEATGSVADAVDGDESIEETAEQVVRREAPPSEEPEVYKGPNSAYVEEGFEPDNLEIDFGAADDEQDSNLPRVLSDAQIQSVIDSHQDELVACYGDQLQEDPDLSGRVDVDFAIHPEGRVAMVQVTDSTLRSHAAEDCLVERARRWTFPEVNQAHHTQFDTDFEFSY